MHGSKEKRISVAKDRKMDVENKRLKEMGKIISRREKGEIGRLEIGVEPRKGDWIVKEG